MTKPTISLGTPNRSIRSIARGSADSEEAVEKARVTAGREAFQNSRSGTQGEEEQTGEPFRGPGRARPGERGEASTEVTEGRCGSKVAGPWGRRAQPPGRREREATSESSRHYTASESWGGSPPSIAADPSGRACSVIRRRGPRPASSTSKIRAWWASATSTHV